MPVFQTILCTTDFSESSRQAFRVACSLAREGPARLIVLHVVEPPIIYGGLDFPPLLLDDRQAIHATLEKQLRESYVPDHSLEVEYRMRDGAVPEEIVRAAEELGCDLIVMGTHGRTGLRRALVGSVAELVLRRAHCAVLTIKVPVAAVSNVAAAPEATTTS